MKNSIRIPKKCSLRLVLLVILSIGIFWQNSGICAAEQEQEQEQVLRVAFPQVEGFSETDEYGNRHGIVVDYLNEIAKYTGWKYEYIDTDSESLLPEFIAGKYDLMGGTYYKPEFEKYFAYPDYNAGYGKSVLLARREDKDIKAFEWKSMSGKTIGVYERAEENIRRLEQFMESNGIDCTIKYYKQEQLIDGNLYAYLESGEIDMLLGNDADDTRTFRVVAEFDSQPHYIVTTPGNKDILDGLNMAQEKILDSNPNFARERYDTNIQDYSMVSIFLNTEEKNYIRQKKTVSVAVLKEWHPFFRMDAESGLQIGLVPDVLKEIEEFTGLKFTYQYADSYAEGLELVQQGKTDILGVFLGTEEEGSKMDIALTAPYAALNDIVARNKSSSFPSEGLTGAVIEGRELPRRMNAAEVKYYKSAAEALRAVNSGEVDFFYGLSTKIEQVIQEHHYVNVVPNTLVNDRNDISFAMKKPAQAELLTILNKAVNSLSSQEKDALANQNMISTGVSSFSIIEMIYADPVLFVMISGGIFLLLTVLLLMTARSRVRAVRIQGSLEKAEAASRAKGEFLSRMSHEIRTPMNAIVGLSDLTCMLDGVPENVRENLSKIRSSSHYLLKLISDILDMSRIESGRLTIGREPFSIGQLMEELKSMMEAEADKRGLEFTVETEITDDALEGDAIRLKQVLTNLVSNAFKFTPAGGKVLVHVKETERSHGEAGYFFQVIDNGMGISRENQERIFETFEQVGTNYSRSQGTGLGLAISKTIVKLMGGELGLKSEQGQGSEFYFNVSIPIGAPGKEVAEPGQKEKPGNHTGAGEQEAAGRQKESEAQAGQNRTAGKRSLEQMCILLAEDNDLNAEIAGELLRMQKARVRRAENGQDAVEMFGSSEPGEYQAILMDIRMPVMDGLEACRVIRHMERPDAAGIPIIAMTANSFKEDEEEAAAAGMNGFVTKPVDVEYLYDVLQKTMDTK